MIRKQLAVISIFFGFSVFLFSSLAAADEEVKVRFDQTNPACNEIFASSPGGLAQHNLTSFAEFDLSPLAYKDRRSPELINDDFNLYHPHLKAQGLAGMKYSFSTQWYKPEEIFLYGREVLLSNLVLRSQDGVNWESFLIIKDTKSPEHCALIGEGRAVTVAGMLPSNVASN